MSIKTFGPVDERSLKQLERCMAAGDAELGVLCADHHPGYSQPIGGGIAYEGYVSPSGVGYDIGCGNKAARTELTSAELDALGGTSTIMAEISRRISFGIGVPAKERADHPVLEKIRRAEFAPQRKLAQQAAAQLGTAGAGNHYVNLMQDEDGYVWVGVHFGSRGFGHKTASGFLALAQGLPFDGRASEGDMDSPPVLFDATSELGHSYVAAMELAGEYAQAGRDIVVDKVLEILGADPVCEVHNHHNFAWREEHFGRTYWVIRKGCTPATPGQQGFVGGSMGDESVILEGIAGEEATESLYSTVHGAGHLMSRTAATGRIRRRAARHHRCFGRRRRQNAHHPRRDSQLREPRRPLRRLEPDRDRLRHRPEPLDGSRGGRVRGLAPRRFPNSGPEPVGRFHTTRPAQVGVAGRSGGVRVAFRADVHPRPP